MIRADNIGYNHVSTRSTQKGSPNLPIFPLFSYNHQHINLNHIIFCMATVPNKRKKNRVLLKWQISIEYPFANDTNRTKMF